jgi:hypothetical protein
VAVDSLRGALPLPGRTIDGGGSNFVLSPGDILGIEYAIALSYYEVTVESAVVIGCKSLFNGENWQMICNPMYNLLAPNADDNQGFPMAKAREGYSGHLPEKKGL